ncbi:MAG: AIR synthase related protein, partial [Chloroflexota bacterium]
EPLGLTNCLNFGNPEKPHIAWQLTEAVEGLAQACEALGVPVVGGNVSLYNEGPDGPILPTPVVGMVGELPDVTRAGRIGFAAEGDAIALIGSFKPSPAASELGKLRGEAPAGPLPEVDLAELSAAHRAVRGGLRSGSLRSAHDVSEGGIAVALAECCAAGGVGAEVSLPAELGEADVALFGEAPGTAFLVSGHQSAMSDVLRARVIGRVGGDRLRIGDAVDLGVEELRAARDGGLAASLA